MSNIVPFNFDGASIRVVEISGESWFIGKDIAEALGYSNPSDAISTHCKGVAKRYPLQTPGGKQEVRVLSEPDVLRLIVNSTLPAAERFERWVFEDVLPSIRKTGSYTAPKAPRPRASERYREADAITRYHLRICKLLGVESNMAKVITAKQVKLETGLDCAPMLAGVISVEETPMTPTELAKHIGEGVSAAKVNIALEEAGLQVSHIKPGKKGKQPTKSYAITDAGKEFGSMEPYQSEFSEHAGFRPKWFKRVVELIRPLITTKSNVVQLQGAAS